jgi:hypothetical protein
VFSIRHGGFGCHAAKPRPTRSYTRGGRRAGGIVTPSAQGAPYLRRESSRSVLDTSSRLRLLGLAFYSITTASWENKLDLHLFSDRLDSSSRLLLQ